MVGRRRWRSRSYAWGSGHVMQLQTGMDFLGDAWGDGMDRCPYELAFWEATRADMELAYSQLRDQVLDGYADMHPGRRPWAWWQFESNQPRDESIPEPEQLERMGELSHVELHRLRHGAHGVRNEYYEQPFRRSWEWWRFLSPERRDWSTTEAEQLCRNLPHELTGRERHILKTKQDVETCQTRHLPAWQKRLMMYLGHLTDEERSCLGLPAIPSDDDGLDALIASSTEEQHAANSRGCRRVAAVRLPTEKNKPRLSLRR